MFVQSGCQLKQFDDSFAVEVGCVLSVETDRNRVSGRGHFFA